MSIRTNVKFLLVVLMLCAAVQTHAAALESSDLILPLSKQYLIVAGDQINGSRNTTVAANNFELGANKAPVPSTDNFLDGGSSGGPSLAGNVPNLPSSGIRPIFQGIGGHGNIAIIGNEGEFELQDVGVYADPGIGIRVGAPNDSYNKSSNSFFNDPNHFPNTFNPITQTGTDVNPGDADQSTYIDPSGSGKPSSNVGVTYNYDHTDLVNELVAAREAISQADSTGTLNVSGNSGKISSDFTFNAASGINVIDINTGGNDFLIENSNFIIDGVEDSIVIFRLPDETNMLISNANILLSDNGIGVNNVLFFTDQENTDSHFSFSNTVIGGAAFWSLGGIEDGNIDSGNINISNAQGCVQLIAGEVDMDNVRFNNCAIPEPTTLCLLAAGGLALRRRRL